MTVYATRQYRGGSTAVSPDHGGCGVLHPYEDGPAGFPQITCPNGCEDFLRTQYGHSDNLAKVPETYDEVLQREAVEKQGSHFQQALTTAALAKMAGMDAAASAVTAAAAVPGGPPLVPCAQGHMNPAGSKFCGTCGATYATEAVTCPAGHENPAGSRFCHECGQAIGEPAPARRPAAKRAAKAA